MSDGLALIHTSATGGGLGRVLDLISAPESHGNDNAWYGHADQQQVDLSALTVDEVKAFQQQLLADGNGGSAIGRYQIVPETFATLTERLQLSGNERFTPALQDRLALALVCEAGVNGWIAGRVDDHAFAFNLAKIWAGLPKDSSNVSYYAGDGRNAAHLDHGVVIGTLAGIRAGEATDAPPSGELPRRRRLDGTPNTQSPSGPR